MKHFGFSRDQILWDYSWIDFVMMAAPLSDNAKEETAPNLPKQGSPDELAGFLGIQETKR